MWLVSGAGLAVDDVGVASGEGFDADEMEIVGVSHFADEPAALLALFFFFLFALCAILGGFVLTLVDQLLDLLFFFLGVLVREWFVVFRDQALDLLAVEFHDLGSLYL